jgi:hypothetical protein
MAVIGTATSADNLRRIGQAAMPRCRVAERGAGAWFSPTGHGPEGAAERDAERGRAVVDEGSTVPYRLT